MASKLGWVVALVVLLLVGAILFIAGYVNHTREKDVQTVIGMLDGNVITAGSTFNPGAMPYPESLGAGRHDAAGHRYGVYGLQHGTKTVLLYIKDDNIYAACAYGLSINVQERWWFADTKVLGDYIDLCTKQP